MYRELLEKLAIGSSLSSGALSVYDRDFGGQVEQRHSPMAATVWQYEPPRTRYANPYVGTYPSSKLATKPYLEGGPYFDMPREDGYQFGVATIQGVRAFDPSIGQWATPDAYQGNVHDPMSQRSYMWNDNNPIEYSDPSGYCVEDGCLVEGAVAAGVAEAGADLVAEGAEVAGNQALAASARGFAASIGRSLAGGIKQGLYRFTARDGRTYIGKSIDLARRLAEHVREGFLSAEDLKSVVVKAIDGSAKELSEAEQDAIDAEGGLRKLANKRNANARRAAENAKSTIPIEFRW